MARPIPRWQLVASLAIVGLSVLATALGLLRPEHYRDADALVTNYRVQDATILLVGVPALAAGLYATVRGSLRGRIVWLGALAFMAYIWFSVVVQVSFNDAFFAYLVLFALSLWTFVAALLDTDHEPVHDAVTGRIDARRYGLGLVLVGLALAALWLSELVPAALAGTVPVLVQETGPQALFSHVLDLAVVVPALVVVGVWLRRERPMAALLAGVLFVMGTLLAAPISAMTLAIAAGDGITLTPLAAALSFAPVVVVAGLAVAYLRAMRPGDARPAREGRPPVA
ncbi:hypothetical protein [Halorubellus litoreus]|uniref:Uncharacterized protein n=1 Tax=Halorubellus litoreus TaxID=755308 RepID=A0ABD5VAC8_9EURY